MVFAVTGIRSFASKVCAMSCYAYSTLMVVLSFAKLAAPAVTVRLIQTRCAPPAAMSEIESFDPAVGCENVIVGDDGAVDSLTIS